MSDEKKEMTAQSAKLAIRKFTDKKKADFFSQFFKAYKGGYGAGDKFIGVTVPATRSVARQFKNLPLAETVKLLRSPFHEDRLMALMILVFNYRKGDEAQKKEIYKTYISNMKYINNWDLIDGTANHIVGSYLEQQDKNILYKFAKSKRMWDRRVSIISTFHYIRNREYTDALRISKILLKDQEDLIHKATGWMLREIGNRDKKYLIQFLEKHCLEMPRTMLRYSIEKLPEKERQLYLKKKN